MTHRLRGVREALAAGLVCAALFTACDQPEPTELAERTGFELASTNLPPGPVIDCSAGAAVTKTVTLKVEASDGMPADGALVVALDPQVEGGNRCAALTVLGEVSLKLPVDAMRIFTVRSEVPFDAARLEIVPPAPASELNLVHDPTAGATRNGALIIGGRFCNVVSEFSWEQLVAITSNPCKIGAFSEVIVTLPPKTGDLLFPQIRDLNGDPLPGAVLAAVSAAAFPNGTFVPELVDTFCDQLPFLNQAECASGVSHGPAFVYAMTRTGPNGTPPNGLAVGPGAIVIEAVAPLSGAALFATFEGFQGGSLVMEPGLCRVYSQDDTVEPSGTAALDIDSARYGIGLELVEEASEAGGLTTATLAPVDNTLVVKLFVTANAASTGTITYQLRFAAGGGNQTIRASFRIDPAAPDECSGTGFSGKGMVGGVVGTTYCVELSENRYQVIFTLTGLPDLTSALFSAQTEPGSKSFAGDNLDPARSQFPSASIPFVFDATCPLQLNTDGRLVPTS